MHGPAQYVLHCATLLIAGVWPALLFRRPFTRILNLHDPSPEALDRILSAFGKVAPFVRYETVVAALQRGESPPPGFVVTFDDGCIGNLALLDVLDRHRCPAVFFIATAVLDTDRPLWFMNESPCRHYKKELKELRYHDFLRRIEELGLTAEDPAHGRFCLNSEELREIVRRGHQIGVHTIHHPFLSNLTPEEVAYEVETSYHTLKEALGDENLPFDVAYPDGDYSPEVVETLRELGVRSAVIVKRWEVTPQSNPLELGRFWVSDEGRAGFSLFRQSWLYSLLKGERLS